MKCGKWPGAEIDAEIDALPALLRFAKLKTLTQPVRSGPSDSCNARCRWFPRDYVPGASVGCSWQPGEQTVKETIRLAIAPLSYSTSSAALSSPLCGWAMTYWPPLICTDFACPSQEFIK